VEVMAALAAKGTRDPRQRPQRLCVAMDAAEFKHMVLGLVFLKAASFTPPAVWFAKPRRQARRYFGPEHADTFRWDVHPNLRADVVIANPPFNDSDWFRKDDLRWQIGVPPPAWPSLISLSSAICSLRRYAASSTTTGPRTA
jgi:hypothetical protein